MVRGMAHCEGGDGPNDLDLISAIEQWVEKGKPLIRSLLHTGQTAK